MFELLNDGLPQRRVSANHGSSNPAPHAGARDSLLRDHGPEVEAEPHKFGAQAAALKPISELEREHMILRETETYL